ncbi:hypothetical protein JTE90_020217 [Oedothorax gibbosus]|uniref:SUEL-type lectin domain-containing protein n=1 Tax=Oedothorax gibbosus TaxID=931172 RepID=A0AAV6V0N2_9ARAC|nr:hypothetical protein JTE90_020217 [Oedothorax gibbosus]
MGESCREQRICKIKTSPQTFGNDPCPGVRKYAEVAYKCRPTVFSNKVVCEGERLRLKCDNNDFRIVIFSASFGATRQGVPECPQPEGEEGKTEDCQVVHATEALMTICHGKRTCTVAADAATFGKMGCPPTTRLFLKVVHTCVPKEILKDQDLGVSEETKDPEGEGGSRGGDYTGFIEEPRYAAPVTPVSSVESSKPPQRAAPTIKPDPGVGVWKVGTTTHMQSDENELNVNSSRHSSGFFAEIFHSIRDNKEKFMLYLTLILSLVVVTTLAVLVTKWKCRRTRRLREASAELEAQKNKMKSPIPSTPPGGEGGISPFGNPTDPFEDPPGSVEIVMFTPRSSFKKALPIEEDDCSFPRAPVATHKNFYYS